MSYHGYVHCNCYQTGKVADPPCKEFFRFDVGGMYLKIPSELYESDRERAFAMEREFTAWLDHSCEHRGMVICNEWLFNSSGCDLFYTCLGEKGREKNFPVLHKYLPRVNDGILPASMAKVALQELAALEKECTVRERVILAEKETGEQIASTLSGIPLFLMQANHHCFFLDADGVMVVPSENWYEPKKEILFCSRHFIQGQNFPGKHPFTDVKTGRSIQCTNNLYPLRGIPETDHELIVYLEPDYDPGHVAILALKRLAVASLTTGNPIHWG